MIPLGPWVIIAIFYWQARPGSSRGLILLSANSLSFEYSQEMCVCSYRAVRDTIRVADCIGTVHRMIKVSEAQQKVGWSVN